jgi:hypothetical protein
MPNLGTNQTYHFSAPPPSANSTIQSITPTKVSTLAPTVSSHTLTEESFLPPTKPMVNSAALQTTTSETNSKLSAYNNTSPPNLVRIYLEKRAESAQKYSNYKAVLAKPDASTTDLLLNALTKYGIILHTNSEEETEIISCQYELFDVVGTVVKLPSRPDDPLMPEEQFVELYARNLADEERPLMIQNLWQPRDGYTRRFEIRKVCYKRLLVSSQLLCEKLIIIIFFTFDFKEHS